MSDFPPPGGPAVPPPGSPAGGPAPGWWQASDGNWYPPSQQPGPAYAAPAPGYPAPGYPAPGYPAPGPYGYGYPVQPAPGTNGFAIASLIASIVSCGIGSIIGVIMGHVALGQIKKTGEGGRGLAIAGLVIGYIGLVAMVLFVVLVVAGANSESDFNQFESDFDNGFGLGSVIRTFLP